MLLEPRDRGMACLPRLRCEPDRRVRGAEALVVAPPLDNLEEKQVVKALRVDLKIFSSIVPIVENISDLQIFQEIG